MICHDCKDKNHYACIEANKGKTPSACDCQHRSCQKHIVQPVTHQKIIAPLTFGNSGN